MMSEQIIEMQYTNDPVQSRKNVNRMIDDCPRNMAVVELLRNACEQAVRASKPRICITIRVVNGVRKLAIWNNGPGMSEHMLEFMNKMHHTMEKDNDNYGIGAKVAGLKVSPEGLRYRSCKNGKVNEMVLKRGADVEVYGLTDLPYECDLQEAKQEIVTDPDFENEESVLFSTDEDWTEVTMFGVDSEHNTAHSLNDNGTDFWVPTEIIERFFRIDPTINIQIHQDLLRKNQQSYRTSIFHSMKSKFLGDTFTAFGNKKTKFYLQSETVELPERAIRLHFGYDDTAKNHGQKGWDSSFFGVVCANELFYLRRGKGNSRLSWANQSMLYGIPTALAKHVSLYIELTDKFPAKMSLP
jgi:hypothetical protein